MPPATTSARATLTAYTPVVGSASLSATASLVAQTPVIVSAALSARASMAGLLYSAFSPPEVYTPRFVTSLTAAIPNGLRPTVMSVAATQAVFGSGTFSVAVYDVGTDADPVNFEAFEVIGGGTSLDWTVVTESGWTATSHANGSTVVATVLTPRSITQPLNNHVSTLATPDPHSIYIRKNSFSSKGDLLIGTGGSGQYLPLPVAADGQVLTADSTRPNGVRWLPFNFGSVLTHMGDLLVGGVLGLSQRLGIGALGQFLVVGANAPAVADPTVNLVIAATGSGGSLINGNAYIFAYAWQTPNPSPDGGITLPSPTTSFVATATGTVQIQAPACPVAGGSLIVYGAPLGGTLTVQAVLTPASTTSVNLVTVSSIGAGAVVSTSNTTGGIGPNWRTLATTDLPASPTFNSEVTATDFRTAGLTGISRQARLLGATFAIPPGATAPAAGWQVGDFVVDQQGTFWICTSSGIPGAWGKPQPHNPYSLALPTVTGGFLTNYGVIYTAYRLTMTSNITGVSFFFGTYTGQQVTLVNESAFSMTFEVSGTSLVASGTACSIGPQSAKTFTWDSSTSLWYDLSTTTTMSPSGANHSGGLVPDPGSTNGTTRFLREDASWAVPSGSSSTNSAALRANAFITTRHQVVFGPSGPSHSVGLVTDPGSTSGSTRFLREDGTWAVPAGTGGGSSSGGSGSSAFVPIQTQAISSGSSVTFSVPAGFKNLRMTGAIRTTGSQTQGGIQFNGDSGTNYNSVRLLGNGSSAVSSPTFTATSGTTGYFTGTTGPGSAFTMFEVLFPECSNTSIYKSYLWRSEDTAGFSGSNSTVGMWNGWWSNTAAITSITILSNSGTFIAGTSITLWGESDSSLGQGVASLSASAQLTATAQIPVFGASGAGHSVGLVADPGSTAGNTRFLREDQTWAVPAGTGGGGSSGGGGVSMLSSQLTSSVSMTSANVYYDGPSISLPPGNWAVLAQVVITNASAADLTGKLWDGTTAYASVEDSATGSTAQRTLNISTKLTLTTTTTLKVSVASQQAGATIAVTPNANATGLTNTTTGIVAISGDPILLTPASNLIQETILTSAQATVSIPNIPQGYKDLRIAIDARTDAATTRTQLLLQFNGDTTSANYASQLQNSNSTSVTSASFSVAGLVIGQVPGTSATPTTRASTSEAWLLNYAGTTFHKSAQSIGTHLDGSGSTYQQTTGGYWFNTAAITSITVALASGNLVAGTSIRVFGEPASAAGLSVGTGTRLRISTNQSIASGSAQVVAWDTEDNDADNQHFTSSANLTGTVAKTSGSATLTGTSSAFTTELSVGQVISVPGGATEQAVVIAIASNTSLTVASAFGNTSSGQTAVRLNSPIVFRQPGMFSVELGAYMAAISSGTFTAQIRLNGSTMIGQADKAAINASAGYDLVVQRQFQQWDYIEVLLTQGSGGGVNLTADERTHLSVQSRPTVIVAVPYILLQDQKSSGTQGGTFTSGAWQSRDLNTIVSDTAGISSVASNQFTLPPGTYRYQIKAPAYGVSNHQARLQNITDSATVAYGTSEMIAPSDGGTTSSIIAGKMLVTGTKTFAIQHQCVSTRANAGFGNANSFGNIQIFTQVELWKES